MLVPGVLDGFFVGFVVVTTVVGTPAFTTERCDSNVSTPLSVVPGQGNGFMVAGKKPLLKQ